MTRITMAALAVAASLCSAAALAQSSGSETTLPNSTSKGGTDPNASNAAGTSGQNVDQETTGALPSWMGSIGKAFFSDSNGSTLRSEGEIKTNWANLSDDQKQQVRTHCSTLPNSTSKGGVDPNASNTAGTSGQNVSSMNKLCGYVGSM